MRQSALSLQKRLDVYAGVFVGLLSAAFGLSVMFALAVLDFKAKHRDYAESFFTEVRDVERELQASLTRLNGFGFETCNDATLLEMRRVLFFSNHIRDIGYLNGRELLCTTGVGLIEPPVTTRDYDLVAKNGIGMNLNSSLRLFDTEVNAIIAQGGNYNAVFDVNRLNHSIPSHFSWLISYAFEREEMAIASYSQPIEIDLSQPEFEFTFNRQKTKRCIDLPSYCIYLETDFAEFWSTYQRSFYFFTAVIVLISLLLSIVTFELMKQRRSLESLVYKGIKNARFYPVYQPIVRLDNGEIIGCEALARYRSENTPLFPDQFIPAVVRLRKTWAFTELIFNHAIRELNESIAIPEGFRFSFNLFPADVSSGEASKLLISSNNRLTLVFEITEEQKLEGSDIEQEIAAIKAKGGLIALDDFGTGYSNLDQMHSLDFDYLKIDRSFVNDMEDGSIKSELIPYVVEVAKGLNVEIVAEGVENEDQARMLADLGVTYGQGWYFGKPMSLADLEDLIKK